MNYIMTYVSAGDCRRLKSPKCLVVLGPSEEQTQSASYTTAKKKGDRNTAGHKERERKKERKRQKLTRLWYRRRSRRRRITAARYRERCRPFGRPTAGNVTNNFDEAQKTERETGTC